MSIGHSPGPWKVSLCPWTKETIIASMVDSIVCYMPVCDGGLEDEEQSDRDALLIAAAPEMKALLEDILRHGARGFQGEIKTLLERTGWEEGEVIADAER